MLVLLLWKCTGLHEVCQGDFNDHGLWSEDSQDRPSAHLTAFGTIFWAFSFEHFPRNWMIPFRLTMRDIWYISNRYWYVLMINGCLLGWRIISAKLFDWKPRDLGEPVQPEVKKLTVGDYVKAAEIIEFGHIWVVLRKACQLKSVPMLPRPLKITRKGANLVIETFSVSDFSNYITYL